MDNRILLVDDEPNLLQALRRSLHGRFAITIANGGEEALQKLREDGPFAVVVSDMQMPDVNGLQVLTAARELAPDTVRIMLTGNVDQQTAVEAVNTGAIFRFVNKPCPADNLALVLNDAIRQYELTTAEKVLLSRTLTGSIALVSEVLAIASPQAFGRAGRLRSLAKRLAVALELEEAWQFEVAAMLSQIGSISSLAQTPKDPASQDSAPPTEAELKSQAELSCRIVGRIPRLEKVADMIGLQYAKSFEADVPESVKLGAKMLRLLSDFTLRSEASTSINALRDLEHERNKYGDFLFESLEKVVLSNIELRSVKVAELTTKMFLEKDVHTAHGELLIRGGQELTETLIHRLQTFSRNGVGVREPLEVQVEAG